MYLSDYSLIGRRFSPIALSGVLFFLLFFTGPQQALGANGFITFEDGIDGSVISSAIPGLKFSTTGGYDWIYGDWRTGDYNGKYPDGDYTSNGNFFAWLGPNQGEGRIDFTGKGATYLSLHVSTGGPLTLTVYYEDGSPAGSDSLDLPNTSTGRTDVLTASAPAGKRFKYAVLAGQPDQWVIDDLSTDAEGVPETRNPLILLPGISGSKMENDKDGDGVYEEVWPDALRLALDPWDSALRVLKLAENGADPYDPFDPAYTSVRAGEIIRQEIGLKFYEPAIEFFTSPEVGYVEGQNFILCSYDWRKDLREIAYGHNLDRTLDKCVDEALAKNPGATQVDILAHSMGGLVARVYLIDPDRAAKIAHLVTLGTPLFGAPKMALALIDRVCFAEALGLCFTNQDMLHELLQNYPPGYQISPVDGYFQVYPDGFIRRDRDANGDGAFDGFLSPDESFGMLESHNPDLADQARQLYQSIGGWSNGGTNGVQVYAIAGDQHAAIGTIVEYEKRPWYNPWGRARIVYRAELTNGDGTVPLRSVDMRDPDGGVDLSGGVPVFYFNLDHGELASDPGVLGLAADIFASPPGSDPGQLLLRERRTAGVPTGPTLDPSGVLRRAGKKLAARAVPRTDPLPLNGRILTLDGPVTIDIRDASDGHIGPTGDGASFENTIPGATYQDLGDSQFIFLPEAGQYQIKVLGDRSASTNIRIMKISDGEVIQTDLYDDLPVTTSSLANLSYDPGAAVAGTFALDQDGNQVAEASFQPSQMLGAVESQDHIPPKTDIQLEGKHTSQGWFTGKVKVTLVAEDNPGGVGVAKLEYSLDAGKTVHKYTGAFTVEAGSTPFILIKATDRAGNEEAPLSYAEIGPYQVYLPALIKR